MPISGNIRKFKFDLTLSEEKVFESLADDLISMTKENFLNSIQKVFTPFENSNIIIDTLEIDLGNFKINDLPSLNKKFREALEDYVQKNLGSWTIQNKERVEDAIIFFIQKGYFPWWVNSVESFNNMLLKLPDSFQFSSVLLTQLYSSEKNYFRILNTLNKDSKAVIRKKLLHQHTALFTSTLSFYKKLLSEYELPRTESLDAILKQIEFYFMVHSAEVKNDSSLLFFKTLKYFSSFFAIPFSNLFRFISEVVIPSESDSTIKSLIEQQSIILIKHEGFNHSLNQIVLDGSLPDDFKKGGVKGVISFFERGYSQMNFSQIQELKDQFDSNLNKNNQALMSYLQSVAFYQSKEKLNRLIVLLDSKNYQKLLRLFSSSVKKSESVRSIKKFISSSNQETKLTDLTVLEGVGSQASQDSQTVSKFTLAELIDFIEKGFLQLSFSVVEQFKRRFNFSITKKNTYLIKYLNSTAFYSDKEKLERLTMLLNVQTYPLLNGLLNSNAVRSIKEFLKAAGQEKSFTELSKTENVVVPFRTNQLEAKSDIALFIEYLEDFSTPNFTYLIEFKKLLDSLLEKKNSKLLNYLSSASFYADPNKLGRLITLLTNENYQLLMSNLSDKENTDNPIKYIKSFIQDTSQDSESIVLSEQISPEITDDEMFQTRLLSESPLKLLISFFEKGISQTNFGVLSEYSKLFELLLKQNSKALIQYLSSIDFLNSEIKLERLFSLLTDAILKEIIVLLDNTSAKSLIKDLNELFSDKMFLKELIEKTDSINVNYIYNKVLLIELLKSKQDKRSAEAFIFSFVDRLGREVSMGRSELLFEFAKIGEKEKFRKPVVRIFDSLFKNEPSQVMGSSKPLKESTDTLESMVERVKSSSDLKSLQKNDLEQLLIDLIKQFPNSRSTLEKIIFHPEFSKLLDLKLFSSLFQRLKTIVGIDFSRLILSVVDLIDVKKKKQFLVTVYRVAFQTLISKGTQISHDLFLESLTTSLVQLAPQIFKKQSTSKAEATSIEQKTLKTIIKKVSLKSKSKNEIVSIDLEKFNSLLRLKQDLFENQVTVLFSEEVFNFHEDYDSIMVSSETLMDFLSMNYLDHELIIAFSEITLESKISDQIKKRIDEQNSSIFRLEENLLHIQKKYNIISLNISSLKIILRTFIFKKIGALNSFEQFSDIKFTIDFFEEIKKENYLNFQQLAFYLRSEESKNTFQTVTEALSTFNLSSKFSITNPKLKNELFYKDLVFNFLETNAIPEWANIESFDGKDVIMFIKSSIKIEDKYYLERLVTNSKVLDHFLDYFQNLAPQEKSKILQLIHPSGANFDISILLERLDVFFEKVKFSNSLSNLEYLTQLVLKESFWKQTSLISFIEMLVPFIEKKSKKTKKQLLIFISKTFPISTKLIELKKNVQFSDADKIEVLKFYLEFGDFLKHIKIYNKKIENQLGEFLLKDQYVLAQILKEYKSRTLELERLLTFISLDAVVDLFDQTVFKDKLLTFSLAKVLKKFLISVKPDTKSKVLFIGNLVTSFENNRLTQTTLSDFYKKIKMESSKDYQNFVSLLKKELKTRGEEEFILHEKLLNKIEFSFQTQELDKVEVMENIDLLDYYLEIGSVNFENKTFSKTDLFQILLDSIKKAEFRTKKMVFDWVKYKLKRTRLLEIIPKDKSLILIQLIHSELPKNWSLFSATLEQLFDIRIEKLLNFDTQRELDTKMIEYWIKKNIHLDSSFQILIHLFEEVLVNQKLTDKEFFEDFRDSDIEYPIETSNFVASLKRTYDNYNNKLSGDVLLTNKEEENQEQTETDAIVVQNAGLIILWPYFFRLFDKCGLLIDRKFKDETSLQKGIILTQYLVTGSLEIHENELVLNKILCGAEQRTPVDVKLNIDEVELQICDSLLKGVLQNWQKLNNSSVETLRQTFLIREGILTPNELDYDLDIVKETFDVLLETIPWNISIIQTTFMKNRIIVDWK